MRLKKRVALCWSGGKDAAYALLQLLKSDTYEVVVLLTTFHKVTDRSSMHGHLPELLCAQAQMIGIPLHEIWIDKEGANGYASAMEKGIFELKNKFAIESIAYGDLFLEEIRAYRIEKMKNTGLTCLFPIWKIPTHEVAQDIIESGIKTTICCITSPTLEKATVFEDYTPTFLQNLPQNVDPCGENGEFHTFVYDAPYFKAPIAIEKKEAVFKSVSKTFQHENNIEGHWYIEIALID